MINDTLTTYLIPLEIKFLSVQYIFVCDRVSRLKIFFLFFSISSFTTGYSSSVMGTGAGMAVHPLRECLDQRGKSRIELSRTLRREKSCDVSL